MPSLLRTPGFRALVVSRALSFTATGVVLVALTVLAARGGPTAVGLVLLAATLPRLAGPLAGAFADRVQPRLLLAGCEGGQVLLVVVLAVALPPLPALIVVAGLQGTLATLFSPAGSAAVPQLVSAASVDRAYSALSSTVNLQALVGPALGGVLIAVVGLRGAFASAAVLLSVAAGLLTLLPRLHLEVSGARLVADAVAGLRHVTRDRLLRALVLALFLFVAFAALDNVALLFLVRDDLDAGPGAFGVLLGCAGAGMLVATLALTSVRGRLPAGGLFVTAALLSAAGLAAVGLAPGLVVAGIGQVVAGAGNGVDLIALNVLVQRVTPRPLLGRVFGTVGTAAQLGVGIASAAGGPLVDAFGARSTFLVAGVGSALVCVLRGPVLAAARLAPPAPGSAPAPAQGGSSGGSQ